MFVEGWHSPTAYGTSTEKSPVESNQAEVEANQRHHHTQLVSTIPKGPKALTRNCFTGDALIMLLLLVPMPPDRQRPDQGPRNSSRLRPK
ncbi:hypothetical protein TNCV_3730181 [Trichonephila clavipes]|nr:hypothetical protein TNCV_3730181 [Trichonephila clavipes]